MTSSLFHTIAAAALCLSLTLPCQGNDGGLDVQPIASLRYSYPTSASVELGLALNCSSLPFVGEQSAYNGYLSVESGEKGVKAHVGVCSKLREWEWCSEGSRIGLTFLRMDEDAKGVERGARFVGAEAVGTYNGLQFTLGGFARVDKAGVLMTVGLGIGF